MYTQRFQKHNKNNPFTAALCVPLDAASYLQTFRGLSVCRGIWCILALKYGIWWQKFYRFITTVSPVNDERIATLL